MHSPTEILPGIWKFTLGTPEAITPAATRRYQPKTEAIGALPRVESCPVQASGTVTHRGFTVKLPLGETESVYGLGLQLRSFQQRGKKKTLRVNADPLSDSGDSHAPVPFYVTTAGYGVLIDTARYATFYFGNQVPLAKSNVADASEGAAVSSDALPEAYTQFNQTGEVTVEIPFAEGGDVYIFAGPELGEAVKRYNLFSGGGVLPPRWGLGFWYRCKTEFSQEHVQQMATQLRERQIPCDVLGLEPGWQTHAYSCSFAWHERFPDPGKLVADLKEDNYQVNLWEHAFTHPTSPIFEAISPYSGEHSVWNGAVPDFLTPEARRIFSAFHEKEHIALGISGYKLDECDNSDFTGGWSFPESSRFPSGADGEQMHSLLGLRYQDAVQDAFEAREQRTYGLVRNAHALAAPYPFVLYSDLYDHQWFINGIAQSSFSGLLWTPELRHAANEEDLIRRLQSVVFSPLAMANAWYLWNPPWMQVDTEQNNAGNFTPGWEETEAKCREIIQWRMQFLPYIHAAFVRYHRDGTPPFRALVIDYPHDPAVLPICDQYLMGADVLVAPIVAGQKERAIYLPKGEWFDFWSGERFQGGQWIQPLVPLEQIPLFVKSGTLLPLATPTLHINDPESRKISIRAYGEELRATTLFADTVDNLGETRFEWDAENERVSLTQGGMLEGEEYMLLSWERVL